VSTFVSVRKKPPEEQVVKRSISLPPDLAGFLDNRAASHGQPISYVVKTALELLRKTELETGKIQYDLVAQYLKSIPPSGAVAGSGNVAAVGHRIIEMDQTKLRAAEDPGKSDPQSTDAAGCAGGGVDKLVDPSATSTQTTYPKPQKRKPSA
jgi:hypothetical protein